MLAGFGFGGGSCLFGGACSSDSVGAFDRFADGGRRVAGACPPGEHPHILQLFDAVLPRAGVAVATLVVGGDLGKQLESVDLFVAELAGHSAEQFEGVNEMMPALQRGERDGGSVSVFIAESGVETVRVFDLDTGIAYEVGVRGEPGSRKIIRYTVIAPDEADLRDLTEMPRAAVIGRALKFLDEDGPSHIPSYSRREKRGRPTPAAVAQAYLEGELARAESRERGEPLVSIRQYVADRFGVEKLATVNEWIGIARTAGLLPPATTGRPRRSTRKETR